MRYFIFVVAIMFSGASHAATTPPTYCTTTLQIYLPFVTYTDNSSCPNRSLEVVPTRGYVLGISPGTTYNDGIGDFTVSSFCPYEYDPAD